MTDNDPVPEYQRSHGQRRALAWGILTFYAVTIVWTIVAAVVDK